MSKKTEEFFSIQYTYFFFQINSSFLFKNTLTIENKNIIFSFLHQFLVGIERNKILSKYFLRFFSSFSFFVFGIVRLSFLFYLCVYCFLYRFIRLYNNIGINFVFARNKLKIKSVPLLFGMGRFERNI